MASTSLYIEGGDFAAEFSCGVERAIGAFAHEHQGDAAGEQHAGGFFDVIDTEQRRELVVAKLDDVERSSSESTASLATSALSHRCSRN